MFRFKMNLNKLIITLDTVKLDKHYIYYLLDLIKIINEDIKKAWQIMFFYFFLGYGFLTFVKSVI